MENIIVRKICGAHVPRYGKRKALNFIYPAAEPAPGAPAEKAFEGEA